MSKVSALICVCFLVHVSFTNYSCISSSHVSRL
nr:MAG TPA_asm: hypothetical protein [Bacteriophage sp.]DAO54238.1 MAG TPA: PBP-dependent ABC transporter [Caudoviricetes sp.]